MTELTSSATRRTDLWLRWSAALCASISLVALVSHVLGPLPMAYFLTFFGVPSVVLIFAAAAFGKWIDARVLLNGLTVGVVGGFVATAVYDVVRWLLNLTVFTHYDTFKAIYIFGSWITGKDISTAEAAIAGWVYHFWNGLSIALFYVLTFGRRHWLYAVAWALFMEACTLGLFRCFCKLRTNWILSR